VGLVRVRGLDRVFVLGLPPPPAEAEEHGNKENDRCDQRDHRQMGQLEDCSLVEPAELGVERGELLVESGSCQEQLVAAKLSHLPAKVLGLAGALQCLRERRDPRR